MYYKSMIAILFCCLLANLSYSQVLNLEEKIPVTEDGIEYGYIIKNEQTKEVKSEDYSRFEITVYATNKSGCTKLYEEREEIFGESGNKIASFECNNATGKRLTSKKGDVKAKDFYINLKIKEKDKDGKSYTRTTSTKAGYIFRNGATLQDNLIVIVPKGERPVFRVVVNNLRELD